MDIAMILIPKEKKGIFTCGQMTLCYEEIIYHNKAINFMRNMTHNNLQHGPRLLEKCSSKRLAKPSETGRANVIKNVEANMVMNFMTSA